MVDCCLTNDDVGVAVASVAVAPYASVDVASFDNSFSLNLICIARRTKLRIAAADVAAVADDDVDYLVAAVDGDCCYADRYGDLG